MKLKFFADHCISNFIIQALRGAGCEVIRLRDVISPDIESELGINLGQLHSTLREKYKGEYL